MQEICLTGGSDRGIMVIEHLFMYQRVFCVMASGAFSKDLLVSMFRYLFCL